MAQTTVPDESRRGDVVRPDKGDVGESDRVVLISRDAELLIDFEYWWPMAVPKRS
jgi:hypothetical protein